MPPDLADFIVSLLGQQAQTARVPPAPTAAADTRFPQDSTPPQTPQTFTDSLQAIVGGNVGVIEDSDFLRGRNALVGLLGGGPIAGQAHDLPFMRDRIHLEAGAGRPTRAHEFGHVADFREVFDEDAVAQIEALTPENVDDPNEFFADLFATAEEFLSTTGGNPQLGQRLTEVLRPSLDDQFGEEAVNLMLDQLVRTDLFAAHPMREEFALGEIAPSGLDLFLSLLDGVDSDGTDSNADDDTDS